MRWHEQLKSKTCFLKKVICSNMEDQFQQKRLKYNTRRKQQRALETEEERKERLKKRNDKDPKREECKREREKSARTER